MKCRLVCDLKYGPAAGALQGSVAPAGTVIEHDQAWLLVRQGVAVPADEECGEKAGMTQEQMARAQHAYGRVSRGILPEDYDAYDRGIIAGYNPDGSYKPGPNYDEWEWEQRKLTSPLIIEE